MSLNNLYLMKNIFGNRQLLSEFKETVDVMFTSFVRTEEYVSMSEQERNKIVNNCVELKTLFSSELKDPPEVQH